MPGIIDRRSWLQQRRRFLHDELAKQPRPEQKDALEAELATVDQELGAQRRRWWRWLVLGSRPPV